MTPIYIYIYILSLMQSMSQLQNYLKILFSKFCGQRLSSGHCPLQPDNVRPYWTKSGATGQCLVLRVQGYLNP
jgi:hypothetical protein